MKSKRYSIQSIRKIMTIQIKKDSKNLAFSSKLILVLCIVLITPAQAQKKESSPASKNISSDLFGLFFEDINYAADGGLYAEVVQNRSFEYSPTSKKEWSSFSFWEYVTPGFS